MSSFIRRASLGLLAVSVLSIGYAASLAIGLAVSNGSFQVDHASVRGSATLFDGNVIETGNSSSELRLNNDVSLRLASQTRAQVFTSRLVLENGIGQVDSPNFPVQAAGLQIETGQAGASARVQVTGPKQVVVASRSGEVLVSNAGGVLIARLANGREMTFEPQEGQAAAQTRVSGILALKNGKFIVVDRITNVTMQVQGAGLEAEVGKLVEITGTVNAAPPSVPGASQLIDVTSIRKLTRSAGAAAGSGSGGSGAPSANAASAGLSIGAKVAIIGGVAAAGTVGGLAAAGALPGQGSSSPNTSR